jgi:hypothetical protein
MRQPAGMRHLLFAANSDLVLTEHGQLSNLLVQVWIELRRLQIDNLI